MAVNKPYGDGRRIGAVTGRSQVLNTKTGLDGSDPEKRRAQRYEVQYNASVFSILAEQLLLENNLTPEAAGEQVGIHDIKYLSRLFRRYSGMTITEYLRSCGLKQAKEKIIPIFT